MTKKSRFWMPVAASLASWLLMFWNIGQPAPAPAALLLEAALGIGAIVGSVSLAVKRG